MKRDRRAEYREATRAEIVATAWELCRAEGLAGLSLRVLASRVGLQAPSLYSYFGSKHAIYDAMFRQGCREFAQSQPGQLPEDALPGVRMFMRHYVQFCTADPVRYQLLFQRTIPGFEPSPESFALASASLQRIADWFPAAGLGDRGALDLFTATAAGIAAQQISNEPGGDRWSRLIDQAAEMFVSYVRSGALRERRDR